MKIAVLGTGSMGKTHAAIYKGFKEIDSVTIVGRNEQKTKNIADNLGIQGSVNIPEVFSDASITAVDVCLPTNLHKEFVISALANNKHVFCEIPIAYDLKDATEMLHRAKVVQKIFLVAQVMRFVPEIDCIISKLELNVPGIIQAVHLHRYQRYKVPEPIIDLMGFDLSIVNYIFGMPKSVFATKSNRPGSEEFFAILNYPDFSCLTEFRTVMFRDFPLSYGMRIVGTEGLLEANTVYTSPKSSMPESAITFYRKGAKKEDIEFDGHDPYTRECRYFIDTVLGKVDGNLLDAIHAINTLKIATAIKKSLSDNKEVVF
ncbi:MAG: hypothetical protein CL608_04590 [Anaerolineaceae bacterium]|nr:hypothetical protein [Anaerolineaceae bacterium]